MSKGWPFSLLNDEQMSNWLGVERKPATLSFLVKVLEMHIPRGCTGLGAICGPPTTPVAFLSLPVANEKNGIVLLGRSFYVLNMRGIYFQRF